MNRTFLGVVALAALASLALGCGDEPNPASAKTILMVVTSHDKIDAGDATGLWLEEFAVPYKLFREAGYDVLVASPKGGKAPVDPRSLAGETKPDEAALKVLEQTEKLAGLDLGRFVAVFFPGGHGTMFDLPSSRAVQEAVAHFMTKEQPTAFVCHGPAALVGAKRPDGSSFVKGRRVTGFTDAEERAVKLDEKMPFLLEQRLRELGGEFVGAENWQEHVVVDGNLITGQNPASSGKAAQALLEQLKSS
jgi:putative intracellular protease/amidase